jgi:hypothetical protein
VRNIRIFAIGNILGILLIPSITSASPVGIINNNTRPMSGAPMQIESCIVSPSLSAPVQSVAALGVGFLGGRLGGLAGLGVVAGGGTAIALASRKSDITIRMSNEGGTTITAFRIVTDGADVPVYERENFTLAPGDLVSRKYSGSGFRQNDQARAVNCRVDWVQFADGTTWSAATYQQAR